MRRRLGARTDLVGRLSPASVLVNVARQLLARAKLEAFREIPRDLEVPETADRHEAPIGLVIVTRAAARDTEGLPEFDEEILDRGEISRTTGLVQKFEAGRHEHSVFFRFRH